MSDIESEEYEIMDFPEPPGTEAEDVSVINENDTDQESTQSPKTVLPHSVLCEYTIRDIVESPNTSYTFSTSEYCDNIKELTGEVDGRECPGFTRFTLRNQNWVSNAKMELTLTLNNTKNSKNITDASILVFENEHPNGVSVETDDIDEGNTNFRVITFTYSKNEYFAIKTDLAYSWTLRTLNDSEFNVELTYEPDFFQIIKNLKNNELKSASKRRFNDALQKIYVEQLKKDGNYYCEELKASKDRIHNLKIDLKEATDQVANLQNECESAYSRKEAALIKQQSSLDEINVLKDKLNRMGFLKEYYTSETKIAKDKREFAEKQLKETEEERNRLKKELNGSRIKYDRIKTRYEELEDEYDDLETVLEEVRRKNDVILDELALVEEQGILNKDYDLVELEELETLKSRNNELEKRLGLMEDQQIEYKQTIDEQASTIKSMETTSKDLTMYKDLAKKYKATLELKERDIENLEDIVNEYKNELNKPIKYRENIKSLKADNSYLRTELIRLKQEYKKLNNISNHTKWSNEDIIKDLKKEIAYLKGKRVNKKKIENDINDFHKRGYDMLDWYRNNRNNHTNEFVQFQNETEFLLNDVLNYFKMTFTQYKNKKNGQV